MAYNYRNFSTDDYDLMGPVGPAVGQRIADREVEVLDGEPRRLLDFPGELLVLEMGSITCPLFQSRRAAMAKLDPRVSQAVLYVREAHPGSDIGVHTTLDDKRQCARMLRDDDGEHRTVLIDDLQGTVHAAFGSLPNAVFVLNHDGCVLFRAEWNNPAAVGRAVTALLAGRPVLGKTYFRPPFPPLAFKILKRAGMDSLVDFLRGLPKLIWANLVLRNLRAWRGAPVVAAAC